MPSGAMTAIGIASDQRTGSISAQQQHHQRDRRQQKAERIEREGKCGEAGDDDQRLGPARILPARTEGRSALGERRNDDRCREQAHQDAGVEQHVAGAGIVDGAQFQLEPGPDDEKAEPEPDQPAPQFGIVEAEFDVAVIAHAGAFRSSLLVRHPRDERNCVHPRGGVAQRSPRRATVPETILRGSPQARRAPQDDDYPCSEIDSTSSPARASRSPCVRNW